MSSVGTETFYTYERPMNDALRQEMARTYWCFTTSPMTPHLPFKARVTLLDGTEIGTTEAPSLCEVLLKADQIMEADIVTRAPVAAPEAWWQGAEIKP